MNIKFKTFCPTTVFVGTHNNQYSATDNLNNWLAENPGVEVINWQTSAAGKDQELYIIIQYYEA